MGVGTGFGWFASEKSVCSLGMASPAVGVRTVSPRSVRAQSPKHQTKTRVYCRDKADAYSSTVQGGKLSNKEKKESTLGVLRGKDCFKNTCPDSS